MHTTLGWMSCRAVADLYKILLVGKCLLGEVPKYLKGSFTLARYVHSYNTRHALTGLTLPKVHSNSSKTMFAYEGAVLLNGLPQEIRYCVATSTPNAICILEGVSIRLNLIAMLFDFYLATVLCVCVCVCVCVCMYDSVRTSL